MCKFYKHIYRLIMRVSFSNLQVHTNEYKNERLKFNFPRIQKNI